MPDPQPGENKQDFIKRCMRDDEARRDYPDDDQRYAFCQSKWTQRNNGMSDNAVKDEVIRFRSTPVRGQRPGQIDPEGGHYEAGLIKGVSLITAGEALGHDLWLDSEFIEQVRDALNAQRLGVKSRLSHPGLSGDGISSRLGRVRSSELDREGDQVYGDLHIQKSAHKTPDGDLASYVMQLAAEDSTSFGLSIVFKLDYGAMEEFESKHKDQDGNFQSPDPGNANNYSHARLAELHAVDVVDSPAANPSGLFHRRDSLFNEADDLAAYALGLSNDMPELSQLGVAPDKTRAFVARFLSSRNLEIRNMATDKKPSESTNTDEQLNEDAVAATLAELQELSSDNDWIVEQLSAQATLDDAKQALLSKQSEDNGVLIEEVASLRSDLDDVRKELGEAKAALSAFGNTEGTPVPSKTSDNERPAGLAGKIRLQGSAANEN